MADQLTIDGGAVAAGNVVTRHSVRGLSDAQRAVLARARQQGHVRNMEAGTLVHAARDGGACHRIRRSGRLSEGSCCPWASTDGLETCKRLARRGLLVRDGRRWRLP